MRNYVRIIRTDYHAGQSFIRPRLHVALRWLVVAYEGLCPQAEVIFAYQHYVPLASINWLASLHNDLRVSPLSFSFLLPPFPSLVVSVMKFIMKLKGRDR